MEIKRSSEIMEIKWSSEITLGSLCKVTNKVLKINRKSLPGNPKEFYSL